jgi:hypothetical protein
MTVDRQTELEIRRLYFAEHWKRGTIAAQLGLHHDVVERAIGPLGPEPKQREPRPTVLDPYRSFVVATLERYPRLVATRIYDMLTERGYAGSLRTLTIQCGTIHKSARASSKGSSCSRCRATRMESDAVGARQKKQRLSREKERFRWLQGGNKLRCRVCSREITQRA